jgi:hypothetical protein
MKRFLLALLAISLIFTISCETDQPNGTETMQKASDIHAPVSEPWPADEGNVYESAKCGSSTYPCPPYGLKLYQSMEDFPFIPVGDSAPLIASASGIAWMKDLYQYKEQGYDLILLTISTGWCGYCSQQAGVLSGSIASAYSDSVLFLTVVVQDNSGNDSGASFAEGYMDSKGLDGFDNVFVSYDPANMFQRYMNIAAFPFNAFIDLNTMEIISYESSLTDFTIFSTAISNALNKI